MRLREAFLGCVAGRERFESLPAEELEADLSRLAQAGREAWPDLAVADAELICYIADRIPVDAAAAGALSGVRADDLALACACARGDVSAITAVEKRYFGMLATHLRRTTDSGSRIEDALQALRTKLFVDGKIADYAGRGSLEGWLRVAAARTLLHHLEKDRRLVSDEDLADREILGKVDPELEIIKARYREHFHDAFRDALASLTSEERNLLRLSVIDRLSIDEIGAIRRVGRSSVARWIGRVREKILTQTRQGLAERLASNPRELESVMGLLCSQLDQSLHRFLAATPP